jgi:hypothetical protein
VDTAEEHDGRTEYKILVAHITVLLMNGYFFSSINDNGFHYYKKQGGMICQVETEQDRSDTGP